MHVRRLSIDAKKKENVGNFKNHGREHRLSGEPVEVPDHDFPIEGLGKATPYGTYDLFKNAGFVNVGISADTADAGGSNGLRVRLWKIELQKLADELGMVIKVSHFPPGTGKWNKIEHRLFSFISQNRRGRPLVSLAVIVSLIGATTTEAGLKVRCVIDYNDYEGGRSRTKSRPR